MKTVRFMDLDCIELDNGNVNLLASVSAGPRILSLKLNGGPNLLAELPEKITETELHGPYRFFGGHRLWHAPEDINRTYYPDDRPVNVAELDGGVLLTQSADPVYGIEKSVFIRLEEGRARVHVDHAITNRGEELLEGAPWAITMLQPGGYAILPQETEDTGFLSNRRLTLWPYTDVRSPYLLWGNKFILVDCSMTAEAERLKLGFPNRRGWLACWLGGTLFVKHSLYEPHADYPDFGASSQCYCCDLFVELETLGPLARLEPGESTTHGETWDLHADVPFQPDEDFVQRIAESLRLT